MTFYYILTIFLILNINIHTLASTTFDPKAVDVLLREIRARLQEKREALTTPGEIKAKAEVDLKKEQLLNVEGSGSEDDDNEEGSGANGVPLLLENVDSKSAHEHVLNEKFPRPATIFDKRGNFQDKDEVDQFALNSLMKQAPKSIQERYELNPTGTLQMLKGLDIHGPSGGYHRAFSGGYLPPSTYDPYNVNWHSYGEKGVKQMEEATSVFRRVINK